MKKLLFLTNGHGEDLVAAEIIKLLNQGNFEISVLPLVGEGKAFESLRINILGPRRKLPGGGFSLRNFKFLAQDLSSGLIGSTLINIRILKEQKENFDLVIAIGDIVPILGALLVKAPFIFVGVNKSDYYKGFGFSYTPWEKWLLHKYAKKIYVRDQLTAENLNKQGILAEYVGNPLMDCLGKMTNPSTELRINDELRMTNEGKIILGFLPGTREDATLNLEDFEKVVEELITLKDPDTQFKFIIATTLPEVPEYMEKKAFAEVLAEAHIIIGLSGTGNEQAAGCGIPVLSFYGRGSQYNKKFAGAQKELLGEALYLIEKREPSFIAASILQLIKTPAKMKEIGEKGKQRMGEGGTVEKIADFARKMLQYPLNGRKI